MIRILKPASWGNNANVTFERKSLFFSCRYQKKFVRKITGDSQFISCILPLDRIKDNYSYTKSPFLLWPARIQPCAQLLQIPDHLDVGDSLLMLSVRAPCMLSVLDHFLNKVNIQVYYLFIVHSMQPLRCAVGMYVPAIRLASQSSQILYRQSRLGSIINKWKTADVKCKKCKCKQ